MNCELRRRVSALTLMQVVFLAGMAVPPGGAVAQISEAVKDDTDVDTVVVTARKSVDTPSTRLKRTATGIVDSTTASDIEKTPDLNLAEVLDRVAGVSADKFYGTSEAGYVSLRGFDSRYNSIDIDGNPIWFSSQNNRGAQIGMFPAAIINETSVAKTVTPDMDANSIGGHISMRTLRAFDGGTRPYFKAGYRLGSPENASRVHDDLSDQLYVAGKFTFGPDRRYGLVFGFNRQRTADYDDFGAVGGYVQATDSSGVVYDQIASNVFTDSAYDKTVRNTAVFAKIETRQEDRLYAFASLTRFDEQRDMYLQRSGPFIANSGTRTVTKTGDGTANFTNGQGQVREYDYDMQRNATVFGLGLDYRVSDKGALSLRGNYTDYGNDTLTRNIGAGFRLEAIRGSYDITGDLPRITVTDTATYNDPAKWLFSNTANSSTSAAYNRTQPLRDKVSSLGLTYNYNRFASAQGFGYSGGINWVRLDRDFDQTVVYWALKSGVTLNLSQVTPAGASMAGNRAALNDYDAFWNFMYANGAARTDESLTTDYSLREDVFAAHSAIHYARGAFKALIGTRFERTSANTDTGQLVSGVNKPQHRAHAYGKWLPNAQASYDVTARLKLRAAYTRTLGRPDFADFAPGTTTTFDTNGVTLVRGSNPDLGPRLSTNYDASLEYYFDNGLLSLALFKKELTGETFSQVSNVYNGSGQLIQINTIPLNAGSAEVKGAEFTAARSRFDFLPAPFDRLGASANYSYIEGDWNVIFSDGSRRTVGGLRNQPKWLANLRLSYDAGPLDLTLAYKARGKTFTGTFGTTAASDIWVRPTDQLDAQISYRVSRSLKLSLDARNLTGSYTIQTTGIADSLYNSVGNGRSYWLGIHYSY